MAHSGERLIVLYPPVTWEHMPAESETLTAALGQFIRGEECWDYRLDACS